MKKNASLGSLSATNGQPHTRPKLPGTTPAPVPEAMKYTTSTFRPEDAPPPPVPKEVPFYDMSGAKRDYRKLQNAALNKIIGKLPFDLRETISNFVNMTIGTTEVAQRQCEVNRVELLALRADIKKKNELINQVKKGSDIYKERIEMLENKNGSLKDNIDCRVKYTVRNKRAIAQLSSTNRMLIDSLDALQGEPDSRATSPMLSPSAKTVQGDQIAPRHTLLRPMSNVNTIVERPGDSQQPAPAMAGAGDSAQNNKLRESLLRVARKHYKSMKTADVLEVKVAEQDAELRKAELRIREMLLELGELRSVDGNGNAVQANANNAANSSSAATQENANATVASVKRINMLDERFKTLLRRAAIDPIEAILRMRNIITHVAFAPTLGLDAHKITEHFSCREISRIFDCELITIFLLQPTKASSASNSDVKSLKFSCRATTPEAINLSSSGKSVAAEVIQMGRSVRINNMNRNSAFNLDVDGCPGMLVRKLLSVPIIDKDNDAVLGTVQFLNKNNNENFTEVDELYALMYADQAALLLTSAGVFKSIVDRSDILRSLLEATTHIFTAVPDPISLASSKPLQTEHVLETIEKVVCESLKCIKSRAFLVSDFACSGKGSMQSNRLLMLDTSTSAGKRTVLGIKSIPMVSGLAGHVYQSARIYQTEDVQLDNYFNPQVDLDPFDSPLVTVPIINLAGIVIACIQLVGGHSSPQLKEEAACPEGGTILLGQAAEWLAHQLASPLQYLLTSIGTNASRPMSTPSSMWSPVAPSQSNPLTRTSSAAFFEDMRSKDDPDFLALGNGDEDEDDDHLGDGPRLGGKRRISFKNHSSDPKDMAAHRLLQSTPPGTGDPATLEKEREKAVELQSQLEEVNVRLHRAHEDLSLHKRSAEASLQEEHAKRLQAEKDICHWRDKYDRIACTDDSSRSQERDNSNEHSGLIASMTELHKEELDRHRDIVDGLEEKQREWADKLCHSQQVHKNMEEKYQVERSNFVAQVEKLIEDNESQISELEGSKAELAISKTQLNDATCEIDRLKHVIAEIKARDGSKIPASSESLDVEKVEKEKELLQEQQKEMEKQKDEELKAVKATLTEKEELVAILQAELVKLAGDTMEGLHKVLMSPPPNTVPPDSCRISSRPASRPSSAHALKGKRPQSGASQPPISTRSNFSLPPPTPSKDAVEAAISRRNSTKAETPGLETSDWIALADDQGNVYYMNTKTNETSWEKPANFVESVYEPGQPEEAAPPVMNGDWMQAFDGDGNQYWINQVTNAVEWEVPVEGQEQQHYGDGGGLDDIKTGEYTIEL